MTRPVKEILSTFEKLSAAEKHEAAIEILRRSAATGDLPEDSLAAVADELFVIMDKEESRKKNGGTVR